MTNLMDLPVVARFAVIMRAIRHYVAESQTINSREALPLIEAVWLYLGRVADRFARIAAQVEAGTLKPPRPRKTKPRPEPDDADPAADPVDDRPTKTRGRLPRRPNWLRGLAGADGHHISAWAQFLETVLRDPEMQALIKQAPQLARLLRPLLPMLGITDPTLLPDPPATTRRRARTRRRRTPAWRAADPATRPNRSFAIPPPPTALTGRLPIFRF